MLNLYEKSGRPEKFLLIFLTLGTYIIPRMVQAKLCASGEFKFEDSVTKSLLVLSVVVCQLSDRHDDYKGGTIPPVVTREE